ncbi:MAG: Uma2 family endonuclease [Hydrococcus sp. C42_A2020_068]|nr:Uma2 family endonuclease [Hydrococcus sp. C42_A2020_068]
MTTSLTQVLSLEDFLKLPYLEDSPAWEYVDGVAIQKPMPKTRHSILQKRLLAEVDSKTADYTALPELRCTFGGRSIVPDVAVIAWNRINLNEVGEPEDDFTEAPDWIVEILSPDRKVNRAIDNILHCLKHGSKLGWMLDPDDYSVTKAELKGDINVLKSEVGFLKDDIKDLKGSTRAQIWTLIGILITAVGGFLVAVRQFVLLAPKL